MPAKNVFLFDIDDNVLFMKTELHLYITELKKKHVEMTSGEYAKHADFISDKLPLYEFRGDTFENMGDQPGLPVEDQTFVKDVEELTKIGKDEHGKYGWQAPCFEILQLAVACKFPVAFVTARSHTPETIKAGISVLVKAGFLRHEPNYIGVYAVNNDDVRRALGDTDLTMPTPELKRRAIREVVANARKLYGEDFEHTFWMSDDDQKNITGILTAFRELKAEFPLHKYYVVNSSAAEVLESMLMTEIIQPPPNSCENTTVFQDVHAILDELNMFPIVPPGPKPDVYRTLDQASNERISCRVVAGTHCAIMSFDATEAGRKGLVGFSVKKHDVATGYDYWLGFDVADGVNLCGARLIQDFQWGDYTLVPGNRYDYTIFPVYTTEEEGVLAWGPLLACHVAAVGQKMDLSDKSITDVVCFNRACAGSQAYLDKFGPNNVNSMEEPQKSECLAWLSRGLGEKMCEFIGLAKDDSYGIRAALYEFSYPDSAAALRKAMDRGVTDIRMVFHAKMEWVDAEDDWKPEDHPGVEYKDQSDGTGYRIHQDDSTWMASQETIKKYNLGEIGTFDEGATCIKRTHPSSSIHHNKFIVLTKDGEPVATWTGGCNLTTSGVCGQSNVGHAIFDKALTQQYLTYWNRVCHDPQNSVQKPANEEETPRELALTPEDPRYKYQPFFSPRPTVYLLNNCDKEGNPVGNSSLGDFLVNARPGAPVFISLPFGCGREIGHYLTQQTEGNTYILFNKPYLPGNDTQYDIYKTLLATPRVYTAFGDMHEKDDPFGRWHHEHASGLSHHVLYVHIKMMLIDPFGPNPIVVTGSANFSNSSMTENDENLVVVRDNPDVAQVYYTEFMRLFKHYLARNVDNAEQEAGHVRPPWQMTDEWTKSYYDGKSMDFFERETFGADPKVEVHAKANLVE